MMLTGKMHFLPKKPVKKNRNDYCADKKPGRIPEAQKAKKSLDELGDTFLEEARRA